MHVGINYSSCNEGNKLTFLVRFHHDFNVHLLRTDFTVEPQYIICSLDFRNETSHARLCETKLQYSTKFTVWHHVAMTARAQS